MPLRKETTENALKGVRTNIVQSIRGPSGSRNCRMPRAPWAITSCTPTWRMPRANRTCWTCSRSSSSCLHISGRTFDALYDCMTDPVHKSGPQPGFIVVLEQIPANAKFDKEAREQLLDIFRDTADYWARTENTVQVFLFFSVARSAHTSQAERANEAQGTNAVASVASTTENRRENAHRQTGGRFAPGAAHEQPIQRGLLVGSRVRRLSSRI